MDHVMDLGIVVSTSGLASVAAGLMVGITVSSSLKTYQIMAWSFAVSIVSWSLTALLSGALVSLLLDAFVSRQFWLGGGVASLVLASIATVWWRIGRQHRASRWAVWGSLGAWAFVSTASAIAVGYFSGAQLDLPMGFWSCIFYSMALSTIFGACAGGLIYRQLRAA